MGDYELHADYNRNGRLEATPAEYALRARAPGAIIVPNLDADRRRLPAKVSLGSRVTLDRDQPIVLADDDEASPIRIVVNNPSAPAGSRFFLRPEGFSRIRLRINDAAGHMLPRDPARPDDIPVAVPAARGSLNLSLTTRTLPGSPIGHVTDLNPRFSLDAENESSLRILLLSVDPAGVETVHDEANFSVAPFVILDNASVAVRVYACELYQNQPSIIELGDALRVIGVPLVIVPPDVGSGDTWVQDQFQHALIQGSGGGWRQVVLHLPRLRADSTEGTTTGNLSLFVASHFPSRDIGVFDDLWARELRIRDTAGRFREISFPECDRLAVVMGLPRALAHRLMDLMKRIDPAFVPNPPRSGENGTVTWSDELAWLPDLVREFRRRAREAKEAGNDEWEATLDQMATDAERRFNRLATLLPFDVDLGLVGLPTSKGQIEVSALEADRIFLRVVQMHDTSNYGGNIEASPPTADAPLGKLVIGNAVIGGERDLMDPDLLRVLFKQRKQPVVQLDSTWLAVGHVDEFMAFVPDQGGNAGFGILRASSELALELIQAARQRYLAGISINHPHNVQPRPSGVISRLTTDGSAPVTRLFRGKVWRHIHRVPTGDEIPGVLEPPSIYQALSQVLNGGDPNDPDSGFNVHGIRYWPGEGPDRIYPADITVRELAYAERDPAGKSTNQFIEVQFLADARDRLKEAFPQARQLPLPVLFDRVPSVADWADNPGEFVTGAFTPDVVNLQPVNGRLLVPRPYGPRMKLADAVAVIAEATADLELPASLVRRINEGFVKKHDLRTGVYWIHREWSMSRVVSGIGTVRPLYDGLEKEKHVIEQFKDSFPGADEKELRKRIIEPNRRHFDADGQLRDGWRRFVLAETMVDIFETYIQAVADELGVPLFWADSWFYHVHSGGIHCGTNVLRIPGRESTLPRVWTVPDIEYGTPVEFEEEDVMVPAG